MYKSVEILSKTGLTIKQVNSSVILYVLLEYVEEHRDNFERDSINN